MREKKKPRAETRGKVTKLKSATAVSVTTSKKSSPRFPWPPPLRGVLIPVCSSRFAGYSVGVGLSEWALVDVHPWIYFRPERHRKGEPFPKLCGEVERLTLFRGPDAEARRHAGEIFQRICARLREQAAKEGQP
jgi:hypothetical protein